MNDRSYYIARNTLFVQWEAPIATLDVDIPDPGHLAHGVVTAHSKPHAFELMTAMARHDGRRMRVRVYETAGGLRGFVTSHRISAVHLWREPEFAQHLLDSGLDPYFLIGCMATCKFSTRLSPKWIGERPREHDRVTYYGLINDDVPEIAAFAQYAEALAELQQTLSGLDAARLLEALSSFHARHQAQFVSAPDAKPWRIMEGLYENQDVPMRNKDRILVRDVRRWTRSLAIPEPSCDFMSISATPCPVTGSPL